MAKRLWGLFQKLLNFCLRGLYLGLVVLSLFFQLFRLKLQFGGCGCGCGCVCVTGNFPLESILPSLEAYCVLGLGVYVNLVLY